MTDEIQIKAQSKRNAYSLVLIGLMALFIVIVLAQVYWQEAKLVMIFLAMACLVTTFIGIVKILEPDKSIIIHQDYLRYQHKYGSWQIPWRDIAHVQQVSEIVYLDKQNLPYVGIRLTKLDNYIDSISPRLASRLIHEQRPLAHFSVQHNLAKIEDVIINFSPYKFINKEGKKIEITGPLSSFLHHHHTLKKAFGYDIFLPASALDRSCEEFSELIRKYHHQALITNKERV